MLLLQRWISCWNCCNSSVWVLCPVESGGSSRLLSPVYERWIHRRLPGQARWLTNLLGFPLPLRLTGWTLLYLLCSLESLLHNGVNIGIPQVELSQPVGKNLEKDFALYAEQWDGAELGDVTLLLQYPDTFCMPPLLGYPYPPPYNPDDPPKPLQGSRAVFVLVCMAHHLAVVLHWSHVLFM